MSDDPEITEDIEDEVEAVEAESDDDGASNWGRMEELIDKTVAKHLGGLEGKLKEWSRAAKPSPSSPKPVVKEEKPETPKRSESTPRRKGLFSDSFFKGLGPKE